VPRPRPQVKPSNSGTHMETSSLKCIMVRSMAEISFFQECSWIRISLGRKIQRHLIHGTQNIASKKFFILSTRSNKKTRLRGKINSSSRQRGLRQSQFQGRRGMKKLGSSKWADLKRLKRKRNRKRRSMMIAVIAAIAAMMNQSLWSL